MVAMEIKLMIDPKSNKVIFAEASKEFVDFLIFLLSLPIGTAIKLLTTESMVGSIGNVYTSVTNLNETYLQPNIDKNVLLNPFVFSCVKDIPLSINASSIISSGKLYTCEKLNCKKGTTNVPNGASCPDCHGQMSKEIEFYGSHTLVTPRVTDKNLEGYVKREGSYMIYDDLSVRLISTMAILSMMKKLNVSELEERIVEIGNDQALELLKASLQSTTVLTDVFTKMEDGQAEEESKDEAKGTGVEAESNEHNEDLVEAVKENDESKVEAVKEMNGGEKEPVEVDNPRDMKKNEKAKEREDSNVLKKRPEPEGKGSEKGKVTIDEEGSIKKKVTSKKKEEEPKTPNPTIVDRPVPVRERKSVERLVAIIDTDSSREFRIEKGRGTALKDIPNVAFKLSRRKCDDTCKLLHTILFGRRGKAGLIKCNISRFSGFVWGINEDAQKSKVKAKLYKCNKEKLVDLCEVLDIQVSKANFAKKEEVIDKLIEFLEAPHVTTSELLSEKEHPSKGKKRSSRSNSSKMGRKSVEKIRKATVQESGSDSDSEEEEEEEKSKEKHKLEKAQPSTRKSEEESKSQNVKSSDTSSIPKPSPTKTAKRPRDSDITSSAPNDLKKKKSEPVKEKYSAPMKPASKEITGTKNDEAKNNSQEEEAFKPSDDQLRVAIRDILKQADFSTFTSTDILKQLAKQFESNLTARTPSIRLMIHDELTRIPDEEDLVS